VKVTFCLAAPLSGRWLTEEALLRIGVRYPMNFVWATFLRRLFTDEWIDVRQ
jgi:hypothetical protein